MPTNMDEILKAIDDATEKLKKEEMQKKLDDNLSMAYEKIPEIFCLSSIPPCAFL